MSYRVVFCGTPEFAVPSLLALKASRDFSVEKVFSQPDRPAGRGKKLQVSPVKKAALELGLSVETPQRISDQQLVEQLSQENYDVAVVVAYGQILSQSFLDAFRKGCVNVHSSLLPRWRGAAPMQRALMAGDTVSGVCLQKVVKKLDAGPLIASQELPLSLEIGSSELFATLSEMGAQLVNRHLKSYIEGEIQLQDQDESKATHAKKISKDEAQIDWQQKAMDIHNKIRGLDMGGPYAMARWNNKVIKIQKSFPNNSQSRDQPGCVVEVEKDHFVVSCGQGALEIRQLQPESKSRMSAADFIRGYSIKKGDRFE